eukprot:TRINITY_DN2640_c0_g1_i1.p1 TRINITY_DN2640_c0_g1~~TRINITY_DN2640_c0_g1_i1.p1  ORF type:complete len:190 (+),score=32.70 TRINITY_DN2640_c0_g1_i1:102-671(+)
MATSLLASKSVAVQGLGAAQLRLCRNSDLARTRRFTPFRVLCSAEPPTPQGESSSTPLPSSSPAQPQPLPIQSKAKPGFGDVFAFAGPGPETINGRLAMLGFTSALAVEFAKHSSLTSQLADPASVSWFALSVAMFSAASLFPMFQGVSSQSKPKGFWSSTAETWNGRAAMLGLIALAITEYVKGASLV